MTHTPLHKLLLVGTARAQFSADGLEPELAAVAAPLLGAAQGSPERQLWLATGAQRLWRRAGYLAPASSATAATDAPAESMPACPRAAEAILGRLLGGSEPAALLLEWLHLLNARGARLPERFLPNMLERATQDRSLRPVIGVALGMRGRWLARHEAAWSWAHHTLASDRLPDTWENGTLDERVAALQAWRRIDPAAARTALQSGWASESPEQRIAFLPCLGIGLSLDDEPFLEAALDDRRKGVRVSARELLARLPDSQLSRRMHARLVPLLRVEHAGAGGTRLIVTPPETCDAAMARDGVGESKHPGLGERAGWLVDMLSLVDPTHWSLAFGLGPDECIALATGLDYQEALVQGWAAGMQLHLPYTPSPALLAWLTAWTRVWMASAGTARYQNMGHLVGAYIALPAAHLHAALQTLVDASGQPWQASDGGVTELLEQLARKSAATWPAPLSRAIAGRLLGAFSAMSGHHWSYRTLLSALAPVLDPAAVLAAERAWPGLGPDPHGWQGPLNEFFHVVRFRHEMILSFQESA